MTEPTSKACAASTPCAPATPAAPAPPDAPAKATAPLPPGHAATERLVAYFESLSPATVAQVGQYYDAQAHFKDPFNAVTGPRAIAQIFEHMFATLEQPHFVVHTRLVQGMECFLTWEFRFRFKTFQRGQDQVIVGASHVQFSPAGLVTLHRDYWDAAEELYEKLPIVGAAMRWLRRRAAT